MMRRFCPFYGDCCLPDIEAQIKTARRASTAHKASSMGRDSADYVVPEGGLRVVEPSPWTLLFYSQATSEGEGDCDWQSDDEDSPALASSEVTPDEEISVAALVYKLSL